VAWIEVQTEALCLERKDNEMSALLKWATPNADDLVANMARVSNPTNQENPSIKGLLTYMMREGHVSPFEMVNACFEINTTRDIGRQILRHRSFSFQEFSQRYADVTALDGPVFKECRLQDTQNRQNSIDICSQSHKDAWTADQQEVWNLAIRAYKYALQRGVAKEQARALLPEGMTPSRMYMNGTMRSWVHYLKSRLDPSTQKEHRLIAQEVLVLLRTVAPITVGAFFPQD
jgi:thymidylate synthase (FAD)